MSGQILIIRGGAIGDFILTLPVLAALRQNLPQARLVVLGYPHIAQLASSGGLADEVHPIEARSLASFFAPGGTLAEDLTRFFARFAVILSYLYDPDRVFQTNVARCSRAQFIAGPHRPTEGEKLHATATFLKPLERLAIFGADPVPRLRLTGGGNPDPPCHSDPSSNVSKPVQWLAAHPGSGSEKKNWPERHWAALLSRLAATTNWHLLLIGGEAEGDRLERLAALWPANRLESARNLPLVELALRLRRCAGYLGHDSGITHLAGALGLRGLALWGETDETVWRPPSDRMRLVRACGGLANLSVGQVEEQLLDLLTAAIDVEIA